MNQRGDPWFCLQSGYEWLLNQSTKFKAKAKLRAKKEKKKKTGSKS